MKRLRSPYELELQKKIANECKKQRVYMGYTQKEVAEECQTSVGNIQQFENGFNNSATILSWYILHGLDIRRCYSKI